MKLQLNLNGNADAFIGYLKGYSRIRESLLLEVDVEKRFFVAKTFTEDKAAIKFASLNFDDANISVVSDDGEAERNGSRIKLGILIQLKRLIQIVERFASFVEDDGNCKFDINIVYDKLIDKVGCDFVGTEISFSSKKLNMKMDGFRISEFQYLDDENFNNNIFSVQDFCCGVLSADDINDIIKTSDIIKIDSKKDALVFYVDGKTLYVQDSVLVKGNKPYFTLNLTELDNQPDYPIRVPISREKFIKMLDKTDENLKVILGHRKNQDGGYSVDRILFDSMESSSRIVIASLQDC